MKVPARCRLRFAVLCLVASVVAWDGRQARAQNFPGPWNNLTAGGILPLPGPPPQGTFAKVIFANARWVVVQNEQGQQYPIATEFIQQFLVRWPASITDLSPAILVEAIGPEQAGMVIQTSHIDLFSGSDQTLVQTGYASVLPIQRPVTAIDPTFQRHMNGFDIAAQNTLYSFVYPVNTGDNGIPGQMHAVGNFLALNPLRLGVTGNNFVTVFPASPAGISMTQVTRGSSTFAQKGDLAFLTPVPARPMGEKSLNLLKLVLYKQMRREDFNP